MSTGSTSRFRADGGAPRLVDSVFVGVIVAVILANALILGLQTYPGLRREYGDLLDLLNALCPAIFAVEISLRIALPASVELLPRGLERLRLPRRLARVRPRPPEQHDHPAPRAAGADRSGSSISSPTSLLITAVIRSLPPLDGDPDDADPLRLRDGRLAALWRRAAGGLGDIGEAMLSLFVMLTLEDFPQYMDAGLEITVVVDLFRQLHPRRRVRRHQRLHRDRAELARGGESSSGASRSLPARRCRSGADPDPALGARRARAGAQGAAAQAALCQALLLRRR